MTGSRGCAFVTGASRGIGRSIVLRLARDGYDVAGCFRTKGPDAGGVEAEVAKLGVRGLFATCDVRDRDAIEDLVRRVDDDLGPITAVVNNAGVTRNGPAPLLPADAWQDVLDVNLTGVWNVCQAVLYHLLRRRSGAIVNISSIVGIDGFVTMSNYAASKAGLIGMSKSLAREAGPYGVRVNVVAPGITETALMDEIPAPARKKLLERVPLGRFARPEDIAAVVAFLVSDHACYVTGQVVRVDGGASL